jgi:hypothetical protein
MAVNAEAGASTSRTGNARVAVQKFGTFLSGMIMPNIAAFIAWGFITAFFIETGWTPVAGIGGFGEDAGSCCRCSSRSRAAGWSTASAAAWSRPWPPWA